MLQPYTLEILAIGSLELSNMSAHVAFDTLDHNKELVKAACENDDVTTMSDAVDLSRPMADDLLRFALMEALDKIAIETLRWVLEHGAKS